MRNKTAIITNWDSVPLIFDIPIMARLMGRSYENVKKMCQRGQFPAFKVGQEWRFEKGAVQNWVQTEQEKHL